MITSPYVSVIEGIGGLFRIIRVVGKVIAYSVMATAAYLAGSQFSESSKIDDLATHRKGVDLCMAQGYPGGEVLVAEPLNPASASERSSVACYGGRDGVRAYFEFDTLKNKEQ